MCLQLQPHPQIPSSDSSDKQRNLNSELNQGIKIVGEKWLESGEIWHHAPDATMQRVTPHEVGEHGHGCENKRRNGSKLGRHRRRLDNQDNWRLVGRVLYIGYLMKLFGLTPSDHSKA